MNIEGSVKNILKLPPDTVNKNLKFIKENIVKAYNRLDKKFLSDTLQPTLLQLLETHLDNVEIGVSICGILFFIYSKLGNYDEKTVPLYLEFLKRHDSNEMACRNALGLLWVVSKSAKDELIGRHIEQLICNVLSKHPNNEKVAVGVSRLVKRLVFKNNTRQNALLFSGLGKIIIESISALCHESCQTNPIVDIYTNLLFILFYDNPKSFEFFRDYIDTIVSLGDNLSNKSYINLDRIVSEMGISMQGQPLSFPKLKERVQPLAASEPKNVYTTLGHGRELISDEPIPVPPGCVYVTFALCGAPSKEPNRIIEAFTDPKISVLLSDPVANLKQLTEYFGANLHVHFPEAAAEASRTYFDLRYSPFAGFKTKDGCWAMKSGLYKMGFTEFNAPENLAKGNSRLFKYGVNMSCEQINSRALKFLYDGSIYPTVDILTQGIDPSRNLSYDILQNETTKCRFSQSWAFANFPGVHYNFICRTHKFPDDEIDGDEEEVNTTFLNRVTRRRANSNAAAKNLLSMSKGGNRKSRRRRRF